jgi:hypothetical protein
LPDNAGLIYHDHQAETVCVNAQNASTAVPRWARAEQADAAHDELADPTV